MINVRANLDDVIARLPTEKQARTALARAINRALEAGRTTAAREVAKRYTVRQGQVRDKARVNKVHADNLDNASLTIRGPALNVADFRVAPSKPQPAKRPVLRVTIGKKQGGRLYPGAFLIPIRPGTNKAFRRVGPDRLPITPVYGPSIPNLVGSEGVSKAVQDRMQEVVVTRLEHEVDRELSKGANRG